MAHGKSCDVLAKIHRHGARIDLSAALSMTSAAVWRGAAALPACAKRVLGALAAAHAKIGAQNRQPSNALTPPLYFA